MSGASCPHLMAYLLSQNGIRCKLCGSKRSTIEDGVHAELTTHGLTINRLPVELLTEIFYHYLKIKAKAPLDEKSCITASHCTDSTPLLLAHVCGYWRNITKSTSMLWSSLAIFNARHKHIPLIRLWLEYADTSPLSITIDGMANNTERQSAVDVILRILIGRCHLWKSIEFRFLDFQRAMMDIQADSLTTLEHAFVMLPSWPISHNDKVLEAVHSSPKIASIRYGGTFCSFPVQTPWAQLRALDCWFSIPIHQFLQLLRPCHSLEVLRLPVGLDIDELVLPVESIELPRLKKLDGGPVVEGFSIILDALVAPQLTFLNLHYKHQTDNDLLDLKNFAARSGFKLQSFRLINTRLHAEELLQWVEVPFLSTVTDLHVVIRQSLNITEPRFPDLHPSYMGSVIARLRIFLSQSFL
ncbi:hypothetical protein BDQ17DRAFT_1540790 [Cyathus striatus]|nr:hypothetical protein BDQ17DRAFT_1540790 [Cyathus striatus]